ncbi:MAG: hypothetical protein Q8M20_07730 [Rhodocyclaceae bacterium]|nr:hypothetical protein [Rhodocyclaceae bacterium]MDZ4216361.1 hypothetical protein [Rhodocyclaceae bacterium]
MELDSQALDRMLSGGSGYLEHSGDNTRWLMLGDFTHASVDVLERLAAGMPNIEGIELGLNRLSPHGAKVLLGMTTGFLMLTDLHALDEQTAIVLGACPFDNRPIRHLRLGMPISAQTAAGLVGAPPPEGYCDRPLAVSVPSINLPVAQALAHHTHELYLEVRDQPLSPDVATALSGHAGYNLTLDCDGGFTHETLRALSGNLAKRVRKAERQNRVYVVAHAM